MNKERAPASKAALEKTKLLDMYDLELRINIEFPDQRRETTRQLTRFVRSDTGMSSIRYSRLEGYNADAVIADQVAYYRELGKSFDWKIYEHDPFPELKEHLLAHGFKSDEPFPVMVLDFRKVREELKAPVQADVRRLVWPEQLDAVAHVEAQVWGRDFSWLRQRLEGWLAWPGYVSVYAGYVKDQPACAGWIVFHPDSQFASLYGGSTVEEFRGQGLYKSVLGARVQEAMQRGKNFLLVEPSAMSQPILSRLGFELLTACQDFEWLYPDRE